ncbi:MAG: DUF1579 domain-containing protein [Acidobacteriota bacterium]
MKKTIILLTIATLILTFTLFSQEQTADEKKMMEKYMELATPGKNHKYLEYFTGDWDAYSKMWMKPGEKPMESKGFQSGKMILGGRYLWSKMVGQSIGGEFTGISITGYDNFHKKFKGNWIDSMGTGMYLADGKLDATGKIRTDIGLWDDYVTGGKSKVKMVTTIINKDKFFFEMYMGMPDGKEFKSLEITYTRKK